MAELKIFSDEEFEKLRDLSRHIRQYPAFRDYCVLDMALAHRFGGANWEKDEWMMEAVLQNLYRLLKEKGPQPTEKELEDYIEFHRLDIQYIPEAVEKALKELEKQINKKGRR